MGGGSEEESTGDSISPAWEVGAKGPTAGVSTGRAAPFGSIDLRAGKSDADAASALPASPGSPAAGAPVACPGASAGSESEAEASPSGVAVGELVSVDGDGDGDGEGGSCCILQGSRTATSQGIEGNGGRATPVCACV